VLAIIIVSMLLAPLFIQYSGLLLQRWIGDDWHTRSLEIHAIATRNIQQSADVIIAGFGRSGQALARVLAENGISYLALDIDPQRVRAGHLAGEAVVFGEASRNEVLEAAGISQAKVLVVTFSQVRDVAPVLTTARSLRSDLPMIARTTDDRTVAELKRAGAEMVVADVVEGSMALASNTLLQIGMSLEEVQERMTTARRARAGRLHQFFPGATDYASGIWDESHQRLRPIPVLAGSYAVGKTLAQLKLDRTGVEVARVRRAQGGNTQPDTTLVLNENDTLVLYGSETALAAAEILLVQGN